MTERENRIAILGCGGFIGSHLLERLIATSPMQIEGVDRCDERIRHLLSSEKLTFHKMDMTEHEGIDALLERCGTVISLAALCNPYLYTTTPIAVIESNFCTMYPIVAACSRLSCRLIHFSTSEVYGKTVQGYLPDTVPCAESDWVLHEETTPLLLGPVRAQRWCYASAKQLLERAIIAYGFESALEYTIVRPFNFIGPGMDFIPGVDGEGVPRVLACFMDALMNGKPLQLVDGGNNRRCFTAIEDAVEAIMCILQQRERSRQKVFNIGNPANETSIRDMAEMMIALYRKLVPSAAGSSFTTESVSADEFYGMGYEDSDRRIPSTTQIETAIGWQAKIGLEEALERSISGFLRQYRNKH